MKSTAAIVMASTTTADQTLARLSINGSKSLIPINGRPAVSYVLDNLRACEHIDKIVIVSDRATYESVSDGDFFVEATSSESQSVMEGVRAVCDSHRCIIMTGDLPLAGPEAMCDLLTYAPDSDLIYPVVEQSDVKEVYPSRESFYLSAREGKFTGASSILIKPQVALSREKMVTDLLNARRNPTALLGMLGAGMAMKLLLTKPAIGDLETQLSRALGAECRVFISHYPELIFSIDSPQDIQLIENELG